MVGDDDTRFATGQVTAGMAGATAGSFSNSAANKAAKVTGGFITDSGNKFSGPVAGATEEDVQSKVFGKGYTDLARGLARSLGQDKWANRDNLSNQTAQENAFLNQVLQTGKANIVTGGFSSNGMNVAANALALGSKGAGSADANKVNPLGLNGDKANQFNARASIGASPYTSRAEALAKASAQNQLQRSLSPVPKWSDQVDKTYRAQSELERQHAQKFENQSGYPIMNRDMTARPNGGYTGTQTQERPMYRDVDPTRTGDLDYQGAFDQALWIDSLNKATGRYDAQALLDPSSADSPDGQLPEHRNIREELKAESVDLGGNNDNSDIHKRNFPVTEKRPEDLDRKEISAAWKQRIAQDAVKQRMAERAMNGGRDQLRPFMDVDDPGPSPAAMLKEELAKLDNNDYARQVFKQYLRDQEEKLWGEFDRNQGKPQGQPQAAPQAKPQIQPQRPPIIPADSDSSFGGKNDPFIHNGNPMKMGPGEADVNIEGRDPPTFGEFEQEDMRRRAEKMGLPKDLVNNQDFLDAIQPLKDLEGLPALQFHGPRALQFQGPQAFRFRGDQGPVFDAPPPLRFGAPFALRFRAPFALRFRQGGQAGNQDVIRNAIRGANIDGGGARQEDVPAIEAEGANGGRFGKEFADTLGPIGDYAAGRAALVKPQGNPDLSLGFQKLPTGINSTSIGFLRTLFDTYMGGLTPGKWNADDPMSAVRSWLAGARINPEIDPRIEANLIRAGIDKANSSQKAENVLGVLPRTLPNGQVMIGAYPMRSNNRGQAILGGGSDSQNYPTLTAKEGLKSGRWTQEISGSSTGGQVLPHTMPINSTVQANFMNALMQYEAAMKGAGHKQGSKNVRLDRRGNVMDDSQKENSVSGPIQF